MIIDEAPSHLDPETERLIQRAANFAHKYPTKPSIETPPEFGWPAGPVVRAMMKGLLEIASQDYSAAEETLCHASTLQSKVPISINFGSAHLLLAYLYHCWGQPELALKELAPVLAHHQQRETPGLLLMAGPALMPLFQLAVTHNVHAEFASQLVAMLPQEQSPNRYLCPKQAQP